MASVFKSRLLPSILLTVVAAVLLVWHVKLDDGNRIDAWAVALLIVVFLPWLGGIFETIEFPGGGKVQWRSRVEAEQDRQAQKLEAVTQFLTAGFLTDPEREALQRLDSSIPWPADGTGLTATSLVIALLRDRGLIDANPPAAPDAVFATMQEAYRITPRGRQYLDLIAELPADNG